MGVQRIKELVLLLIGLVYGIYVDGQQISYVKMKYAKPAYTEIIERQLSIGV